MLGEWKNLPDKDRNQTEYFLASTDQDENFEENSWSNSASTFYSTSIFSLNILILTSILLFQFCPFLSL